MTVFMRNSLYKIADKDRAFNLVKHMDFLTQDKYTVHKSGGFLIKNRIGPLDALEEIFLYNTFFNDFTLYAYLSSRNWYIDALRSFNMSNVRFSDKVFHNVTTSSDESLHQFLTTFAQTTYEGSEYIAVCTVHSPLNLAIKDHVLVSNPGDYSYINYLLCNNFKFLRSTEPQTTSIYEIEEMPTDSIEAQYKAIEATILYKDKYAQSRIYNAVLPMFPNTVISDIAAKDEMVDIESYGTYILDETDISENHPDMSQESIIIGLCGEEVDLDTMQEDFYEREVVVRTYEATSNPNKLFEKLNGFFFDHERVTDARDIKASTQTYLKEHLANPVYDMTIVLGDAVISLKQLPEWKAFLLIPFVRIQILDGLDLNDPELDVLDMFIDFVNEQLAIT